MANRQDMETSKLDTSQLKRLMFEIIATNHTKFEDINSRVTRTILNKKNY